MRFPRLVARVVLAMSLFGLPAAAAVDVTIIHSESQGAPLTLQEAYQLALKRSEEIAIHREILEQTEGRFLQALGGALPHVSFSSSDTWQDGTGASAFTQDHLNTRRFVFTQPLFSGFKEFAAIAGSRAERRQRREETTRAEQLLLLDVVNAYSLLLEQRRDLQTLEAIRTTLLDRLEELGERERLGRTRASETASARAELRRVEAQMQQARGDETTARQLLEFLTGLPKVDAVGDLEPPATPLEPEHRYLAQADMRADVRAAQEAWTVARRTVTVERSALWPDVDLESNYYTDRSGAAAGVDWDVLLLVDVPIFQGGENWGAAEESASLARQAQLRFEQTRRRAALEIRQALADTAAAIGEVEALEHAQFAAEENYQLQAEDYQRSLVNNLDVLQALQALEDARRAVVHARYEMIRRYWMLRVATGDTR